MIEHIKQQLNEYQPILVSDEDFDMNALKRSAVAILLYQGEKGLELLMIKRADKEGDPWSGHMAFPGGRYEVNLDTDMASTAKRETLEEIGVNIDALATPIGQLSDVLTPSHAQRTKMSVSVFVYEVAGKPSYRMNHEVADVLWVPLSLFLDETKRDTMQWEYQGNSIELPCYFYQEQRIWGLSLKMLDELVLLTTSN